MRPFHQILGNNLVANVTNFTVWFGITFWVYLETGSVFATGMIAGVYLVLTAGLGFWFGSIVDHHRKKVSMLASSGASLAFYALAMAVLQLSPERSFSDPYHPALWGFVLLVMLGVIAGNLRSIALPTLVTVLIPEDERDRANGLVGMVTGIGFLTTSVISGFLVAHGGMRTVLALALVSTTLAIAHLASVAVPGDLVAARHGVEGDDGGEGDGGEGDGGAAPPRRIDLRGTVQVVSAVPGLFALILFATFNNFLGGVFMALLDAYGLSLVSVQTWGLLFGALSTAFIMSGIFVAKKGLGANPVRTLLLINVATWSVCCVFTLRSSIWLLAAGCFVWMALGPAAEAAEHTTLQRVVPLERQGRVFGFAQSIEQAASPLTAFLIGPLTQFAVIPFMTDGAGARTIGDWFGRGPERGMALVFTIAGLVGLTATLFALRSSAYRSLSEVYVGAAPDADPVPADAR